jgi:HK97 family phage major capsid protein
MDLVIVEQDGMFVVFAADEQGEPVGEPIGAHLKREEAEAEVAEHEHAEADEEEPDEVPAKTEKETPMEINETVAAVLEALKADKAAEQEAAEAEEQIRADERAKVEAEIKARTPAWKGGFAFPTVSGNDSSNEATDAFLYYLRTGDRIAAKAALQEGTSSEGGFLVPDDFYARIIARRNERSFVRQLGALVIQTSRDVVDIPVEGTATTTFVGTAEESNYDQNEVVFDPLSVTVHKFTKFMLASNELLADQAANLEEFIMLDLAEKMAMTENRYVAVGTGSTQHWGVFTTDASYSPAIYALTSDQATAAAVVGSLYTLPAEYRENAAWLMNGVTEGQIRAIKDDTYWAFPSGNSAGGQGFKINSLMDRPLFNQKNISAVSDGTSDAQVRIWAIGDFSKYAIVERAGLEVSRNPYLYQLSDQTAIFAKFRQGGAPMLAEAFVLAETLVNAS